MACPKCGCKLVYQFDDEDEPQDDRLQRCAACGVLFDLDDHIDEDDEAPVDRPADTRAPRSPGHHEWDDDGCCIHCGFDGAEWHWWKHSTYEGRAQPEAKQPPCKVT